MLRFIDFSCQGVSSTFKPFNALVTLKQMKGSYIAEAIVAEYEHVIEICKLPITKLVHICI